MKRLPLLILILFLPGCASGSVSGIIGKGKPHISGTVNIPIKLSKETFKTPYGIIERGYAPEQVKQIMGDPHKIVAEKGTVDIWYYDFGDNRYFVHFIDSEVVEVSKAEGDRL